MRKVYSHILTNGSLLENKETKDSETKVDAIEGAELLNASSFELIVLAGLCIVGFNLLAQMIQERNQPEEKHVFVPKEKPIPRPYTLAELRKRDGSQMKDIWICVQGKIYDVSSKPGFYGPGGGYHLFAGRDATRALALTSLEPENIEKPTLEGIDDLSTLNEWIASYESKYDIVGWIVETDAEVKQWEQENEKKPIKSNL